LGSRISEVAISAKLLSPGSDVMDPQHDLRIWIDAELKKMGYGSAHRLAKHLGVDPHTVSRMKNVDGYKESRRIEADMIPKLARFFGCIPPGFRGFNKIRCKNCPLNGRVTTGGWNEDEVDMPNSKPEKPVKIEIKTPQQGVFVIGDNNTITTHNHQISGSSMSPEQTIQLDESVKRVAASRHQETSVVWKDLCAALEVADSALITKEVFPAAQKILSGWEQDAVRAAVNEGL
jgi:hypothetical protein